MISRGKLKDDILTISHSTNDTTISTRVDTLINEKLLEICKKISIRELRTNTTVDMTSSDYSDGMWLPGDLLGIDRIWDEDSEIEFVERDRPDVSYDEYGYRFYRYCPSQSPLKRYTDLALTSGAAQFTSASLDTYVAGGVDVTGEWVRFADGFGIFQLTNTATPYTFTPTYYGATLSSEILLIRPPEMQKLVILDQSENELEDRDVVVYYWKRPASLFNDDQIIPLPSVTLLKLLVLRELPQAKPFRPVSERELTNEWAELKRVNPSFPRKPKPRDRHNNMFRFKTNPFQRRPVQ